MIVAIQLATQLASSSYPSPKEKDGASVQSQTFCSSKSASVQIQTNKDYSIIGFVCWWPSPLGKVGLGLLNDHSTAIPVSEILSNSNIHRLCGALQLASSSYPSPKEKDGASVQS